MTYDGANLKPGSHILFDNEGFELFKLIDDSGTYTYAEIPEESEYYDSSYYRSFDDNSTYRYDNPSIGKIIRDFEEIAHMSPNISGGRPTDGSVNFIKYAANATEIVPVSDTLRPEIKAGDILYIYKDDRTHMDSSNNENDVSVTVEYMFTMTEELEGCTYERFVAAL